MRVFRSLVFVAPLLAQTTLTPEQRGRRIYEEGVSAGGSKVEASIGPGAPVAGSLLPCKNCHGLDGLGRAEGGVVPADITWDALTKPYGMRRSDGRTRGPYTERLARRAITMGLDSDGNALHKAMPRYQLSQADAADLTAYLKILGRLHDPGLTDTVVRVGVFLPPGAEGPLVREAMTRHFAAINRAGGVYGRTVEVVVVQDAESAVFVLCGDLRGKGAPSIPAVATLSIGPDVQTRDVFYLDAGGAEASGELLWTRATATAEILTEAMKRAGRGLTRRSFIQALESFDGVKTSLPNPVTFGPNRRVGIAAQK